MALPFERAIMVGIRTSEPRQHLLSDRETAIGIRWLQTAVLIAIVGPLFYIVFTTVLGVLWEGYDPLRQTQSELGAVDSPFRPLMNIGGFIGLGVSILAFASAYYLLLSRSWVKNLAVGFLVIAGVGMVVVGFFPCDVGCVDLTRTGQLHSIFSMPPAIGLPAAAMVSAVVFQRDGRFSSTWRAVSFWLGLVTLGSGPIIAVNLLDRTNGLLQRAAMWIPLLWITAVSLKLWALARPHLRVTAAD